ncbi:MAG: hypothetical protein UX63_C0008G0039 [Microgenomates group bacterium GW2011_GWB1_46_7]|nr:MAG: hypothetical protein UX63_C0008G0039 [Microgenomates group bacterium GW2011_GWB1_46_7]
MFDWWVRLDEQTVRIENSATYKEILHWGAKPRDTRSQTDMELSFTSVKDPTRLINRLKAKGAITNGLIGLAVLAASYVIIKFLQAALGLDLLNILWPTAG